MANMVVRLSISSTLKLSVIARWCITTLFHRIFLYKAIVLFIFCIINAFSLGNVYSIWNGSLIKSIWSSDGFACDHSFCLLVWETCLFNHAIHMSSRCMVFVSGFTSTRYVREINIVEKWNLSVSKNCLIKFNLSVPKFSIIIKYNFNRNRAYGLTMVRFIGHWWFHSESHTHERNNHLVGLKAKTLFIFWYVVIEIFHQKASHYDASVVVWNLSSRWHSLCMLSAFASTLVQKFRFNLFRKKA